MKRILSAILILIFAFSVITAQAWADTKAKPKLVDIDGNTITVRDDGTGESSNQNGMEKTVILTNREIGYKDSCGPFSYEVHGIQISKIKASGPAAAMLGLEDGQEAAVVAIQISVENTSSEDLSWFPDQSIIVTSDKEQVTADLMLSDSVGGQFYGNVVKDGQIFWICEKTDADNLTHIQWRIDSPADSNYKHPWDDVKIEFDFPKD